MIILIPFIILILAIPIYFLFKRILKRQNIGTERSRKFISVLPTLILSPLIYVVLVCVWFLVVSYYPPNYFDRQEWAVNYEERYKMSEDIIESKLLIGKTKEEITHLLGDDYFTYNETHIGYNLGFVPRFISIDPDVLDIHFKNGKVVKVEQHQS